MTIGQYAEYFLTQRCGGDIDLAKKVLSNSAQLAKEENDLESFEMEVEAFQHLEVIKSNRVA